MGIQETIAQVKQACADMKQTFATLAEGAAPAFERLNSTIGRVTAWQVTSGMATEIRETEPNWAEMVFLYNCLFEVVDVKEIPHPRAEEARQAAASLFGTAATNDAQFKLRTEDIAATPEKLGDLMGRWLEFADTFSKDVAQRIPSSTAYIPTAGGLDGWQSPTASGVYEASASSQNSAADTTSAVITAYLNNCAKFLSHLQGSLASMASLTADQEKYYTDIITGLTVPDKMSFDAVMGVINTGVTIVQGLKDNERKTAEALGTMLNSSIEALLDIASLDRQITEMGEQTGDNGWPGPAPMKLGTPPPDKPSRTTLTYNTQYFKDHSAFWLDVSQNIRPLQYLSAGLPDLPVMFVRIPTFSANQSYALNNLVHRISADAFGKGADATEGLSHKLDETIKAYLAVEAQNAAEAQQIYKQIYG